MKEVCIYDAKSYASDVLEAVARKSRADGVAAAHAAAAAEAAADTEM